MKYTRSAINYTTLFIAHPQSLALTVELHLQPVSKVIFLYRFLHTRYLGLKGGRRTQPVLCFKPTGTCRSKLTMPDTLTFPWLYMTNELEVYPETHLREPQDKEMFHVGRHLVEYKRMRLLCSPLGAYLFFSYST